SVATCTVFGQDHLASRNLASRLRSQRQIPSLPQAGPRSAVFDGYGDGKANGRGEEAKTPDSAAATANELLSLRELFKVSQRSPQLAHLVHDYVISHRCLSFIPVSSVMLIDALVAGKPEGRVSLHATSLNEPSHSLKRASTLQPSLCVPAACAAHPPSGTPV